MELNFDKEIDALLRQTAKSDAAFANGNPQTAHLDADEISAFAENALPEKAKQRLTAHLADCDSCRKNLSELILLNGENEVETVEEEKTAVIAPAITPWYRKLFVFPNLAYTMGALVLAFTGLTAFIVLQNFSGMNADVASSNTNSIDRARSAPVQSEEKMPAAANANSAASDTAAATTNSAANLSPQSSPEVLSNSSTDDKDADKKQLPMDSKPENLSRDESDSDSTPSREKPTPTDSLTLNQPEPENKEETPIVAESQTAPKPASVPEARKSVAKPKKTEIFTERSGGDRAKGDISNTEATQGAGSLSSGRQRQISGKTFNQKDGVWYDSAYRNQPTTNVRRGTNEYQKLDSGLRSIGNQLGGVVVVVWKTKAYRIE